MKQIEIEENRDETWQRFVDVFVEWGDFLNNTDRDKQPESK